jgi:hypothetical protein
MTKFNFMKKFNQLSRAKMKNVLGGMASYSCTFTVNGITVTESISAANGTAAQCQVDAACWSMDDCTNADCAGTTAC